ncbi:MAG TPA: hypothetical protein VG452_10920 [Egibacteraceae bacterium]|nr:hypothetical protein [Actinomycetota bacterium]HWB72719.1 hypothetical protein [Egibacteraceae bacterium]
MATKTENGQKLEGFKLWHALLGGLTYWMTHIVGMMFLVPLACERGLPGILALHGLTVAMALLTGWAILHCLQFRRMSSEGRVVAEARFVALAGLWLNGISLALILVEGSPNFFLDPCL